VVRAGDGLPPARTCDSLAGLDGDRWRTVVDDQPLGLVPVGRATLGLDVALPVGGHGLAVDDTDDVGAAALTGVDTVGLHLAPDSPVAEVLVGARQLGRAGHGVADRRADLDGVVDTLAEEERGGRRAVGLGVIDADERLPVLAPLVERDRLNLLVLLELTVGVARVVGGAAAAAGAEREHGGSDTDDDAGGTGELHVLPRFLVGRAVG
jgi:hypothetical protein